MESKWPRVLFRGSTLPTRNSWDFFKILKVLFSAGLFGALRMAVLRLFHTGVLKRDLFGGKSNSANLTYLCKCIVYGKLSPKHSGEIKINDTMLLVILRDVPFNSALFGLVSFFMTPVTSPILTFGASLFLGETLLVKTCRILLRHVWVELGLFI